MRCRVTSALPHSARAEPVEAPSLSSDKEERPFDKLRANGRWRFILCKFIVCNFANSHLHDCPCEGRRHLPDQPESPMSANIAEMERRRAAAALGGGQKRIRSEEHTSELQSLMRTSYAVFCLKKKRTTKQTRHN